MHKKKILWCGEAHYLSSGYSTYALEVLKRWHATGKYDLMEFASYGRAEDPRSHGVPWKFKTNMPRDGNEQEQTVYGCNPLNHFGEWKFEEACLDHYPDIVVDIRDNWMFSFEGRSPFRSFFNWAIMPAIDAECQKKEWLADYVSADAVSSYTDWGLKTLKNEAPLAKLMPAAPPGADLVGYHPILDKKGHRKSLGIDPDCFIVGTVNRNNMRKLYPELIDGFAQFLREAPEDIAKRTYLYLHTAWPDVGWNIPELLTDSGISHRVIFSYHCTACGFFFPNFFSDSRTVCKRCGNPTATFPASGAGLSRQTLCEIMNLFDLYVQFASMEACGMAQSEAAACGVPVCGLDYAGISDIVRKLNGFPVRVKHYTRERETGRRMAFPDNSHLVQLLVDFFKKPESVRANLGCLARTGAEEHFNWDKTAQVWMDYFDSVPVRPLEEIWKSPKRNYRPNLNVPEGLTNEQFVEWGLKFVCCRPDLVNSYLALRTIRDLNWGATYELSNFGYSSEYSQFGLPQKPQPFTREMCINMWLDAFGKFERWENIRCQLNSKS